MDKKDAKEILWGLYQDQYTHIRHYDSQRSTVTNLLIVIAAALLTFVTYDKTINRADIPLTGMLCIIGLFGVIFSIKYRERISINFQRLMVYRDKLDELLFDSKLIRVLDEEADRLHDKKFPRLHAGYLSSVKVNRLWLVLHMLISLIGLVLTVWAIFWPQASPVGC
jgi:hypothetical protein